MPVELRLTHDATTDVAYLALRDSGPTDASGPTLLVERDREFPGLVAMDFALADGRVVGFEFLLASACLPAELLLRAERIDGGHLELILEKRIRPVLRRCAEPSGRTRGSAKRHPH